MAPPLYVARSLGALGPLGIDTPGTRGTQDNESPEGAARIGDLGELPSGVALARLPVASRPVGPFVSLDDAIDHAPEVRDALLALSPDPHVRRWRNYRALALAAPVSWGMVVVANGREVGELARNAEKVVTSPAFRAAEEDPDTAQVARARHARIDKAISMRKAYVAAEASFGLAAALIVLVGARRWRPVVLAAGAGATTWWLFHAFAGGRCLGAGTWRDLLLALFGIVGSVAALVLAPSETSIARALRARLGLAPHRSDATDAHGGRTEIRSDIAATVVATWAGLSLPFLLDLLRRARVDDRWRAAVFVLFCAGTFLAVLVWRSDRTRVAPRARSLALAAVLGFGVTVAADIASRAAFGAVTEAVACFAPRSAKGVRAVVEQGGRETTAARRDTQSDTFAWFLAVIAAPLSEEMLYRGTLQRVARRAMGARWAIILSALVFGVAHSFAFKNAFYQHIGLGLAFATVFELAGGGAVAIVACAATHFLWNWWLAAMPVF